MLGSNLLRSSSNLLSQNMSYLNRMLAATVPQSRNFSVAFNIKSKFEEAYEKKLKSSQNQPKKE
jgi:hypothetical protein